MVLIGLWSVKTLVALRSIPDSKCILPESWCHPAAVAAVVFQCLDSLSVKTSDIEAVKLRMWTWMASFRLAHQLSSMVTTKHRFDRPMPRSKAREYWESEAVPTGNCRNHPQNRAQTALLRYWEQMMALKKYKTVLVYLKRIKMESPKTLTKSNGYRVDTISIKHMLTRIHSWVANIQEEA